MKGKLYLLPKFPHCLTSLTFNRQDKMENSSFVSVSGKKTPSLLESLEMNLLAVHLSLLTFYFLNIIQINGSKALKSGGSDGPIRNEVKIGFGNMAKYTVLYILYHISRFNGRIRRRRQCCKSIH